MLEKWDYLPRGTDLAESYCCHCSGDGIEFSVIDFGLWQIISAEDGQQAMEGHSCVSLRSCKAPSYWKEKRLVSLLEATNTSQNVNKRA